MIPHYEVEVRAEAISKSGNERRSIVLRGNTRPFGEFAEADRLAVRLRDRALVEIGFDDFDEVDTNIRKVTQ